MTAVRLFSIATGPYIQYWARLYSSVLNHQQTEDSLRWTLFTDAPVNEMEWIGISDRLPVEIVRIERQGWPGDTERRYELIAKWLSNCRVADDLFVYIDSDMLFHDAVDWKKLSEDPNTLYFVRHPGYFRSHVRFSAYVRHPRRLIGDLVNWAKLGGNFPGGAWENRPCSSAYVPRSLRRWYVCGGVWMGKGSKFEAMVSELALKVRRDLDQGKHARWHDESFLNWYFARELKKGSPLKVLGPRYCWDPNSREFLPSNPVIEAVDKSSTY